VFLTNDFLLFRFDRLVLTKEGGVQTVVMPGPLLQVLRPFGRSSDDFDRRFVATFAIPEFRTIHSDYASTSSRVLSYLATYADLPEETAVKILTNEVLIDRLRHLETTSPAFREAVESEMVKENAELAGQLSAMRDEAERRDRAREDEIALLRREADEARASAATLAAELEARAVTAPATATPPLLSADTATPNPPTVSPGSKERSLRRRLHFVAGLSVLLVGLLMVFAVPPAIEWVWLLEHKNRLSLTAGAVLIVLGLAWAVADTDPVRRWVVLGAIVFGTAVGIVPLLQ
jgi:hypothetical protein